MIIKHERRLLMRKVLLYYWVVRSNGSQSMVPLPKSPTKFNLLNNYWIISPLVTSYEWSKWLNSSLIWSVTCTGSCAANKTKPMALCLHSVFQRSPARGLRPAARRRPPAYHFGLHDPPHHRRRWALAAAEDRVHGQLELTKPWERKRERPIHLKHLVRLCSLD